MKTKEKSKKLREDHGFSWAWVIPAIILACMTAITYYPSLTYPFQFDDLANIVKYFNIRHNTFWSLCFRSTRWISLWLNTIYYKIGQFDSYAYRFGNVVGHITTGMLLFAMLMIALHRLPKTTLFGKYAALIATIATGLFLLHPVQTQTVSYVIQGQQEGMAGLFMIAMVLCFLLLMSARSSGARLFFGFLLCIATTFACGTKEIAIVSPLLVIITDWFFVAQGNWQSLRKRLWLHGCLVVFVIGNYVYFYKPHYFIDVLSFKIETQSNIGNIITHEPSQKITAWSYFISQFKVILHYIGIFIWPFNISVDYDWKLAKSCFAPDCIIPFTLLVVLLLWLLGRFRRNPQDLIVFAFLWFFITILPRSSIIPSTELVADYKTYTGSVGIFLLCAAALVWLFLKIRTWWAQQVPSQSIERTSFWCFCSWPIVTLVIILFVPLCFVTYQRNKVWRSAEEFWLDIIHNAPGKARAYNNYGVSLTEKGSYHEAIPFFKKAIVMDRNYPDPCNNLAVAYAAVNQIDQAIEAMKYGIQLQPLYPEGYNNLASFLMSKGDFEPAEKALRKALELRPHYGKAYFNLGRLYFAQGKQEEGLQYFKDACTKADLDNEMGFNSYGSASLMMGRWQEGVEAFTKSLRANPQSSTALFNLAYAYYMLQDYVRAQELYEKFVSMCPQDANGYFNLGETCFILKDYQKALQAYNGAISRTNDCAHAYIRKAVCLEKLGNINQAIESLHMALTFSMRPDIQHNARDLLSQYKTQQYKKGRQ